MEKYKNDGKPYFKKIPRRDARKAAEVWGEGNQSLTDLLEVCIENGILTEACCEGHVEGVKIVEIPYISFEKQNSISSYLLEKMTNEPSLHSIFINRNPISKKLGFALYGDYQKRGEFFRTINSYVQDYIHYNGPIEQRRIKGFLRGIEGKRYQGKKMKEESIFGRILNIMETTGLQKSIIYNAHLKLFEILGEGTLPPNQVEEYLRTIASQEPKKEPNSVIKAVKSICKNASIGINEISQVARKLHERVEPQKTQLEESKEKDE